MTNIVQNIFKQASSRGRLFVLCAEYPWHPITDQTLHVCICGRYLSGLLFNTLTWKVRGLLNRPPPGYQPCSKIWKYLWMVFCHLGSLWLCPSLVKGSRYFIHRLTPLVITLIILSTHSFTTRSITLHFLSEMAYFLVFWYRNVMVFYMPSELLALGLDGNTCILDANKGIDNALWFCIKPFKSRL